jgi:hypothetical protein
MRSVIGACGVVRHSASRSVSGASSRSRPALTHDKATVETKIFVSEAMSKRVSGYAGRASRELCSAP